MSVCVVNVASYDNYMLINSYLTFCLLLFSMTTLLKLGVLKCKICIYQITGIRAVVAAS